MFGIDIFVHAVKMVLNNLPVAIRISAVLMAVQLVVILVLGAGHVLTGAGPQGPGFSAGGTFIGVVVMIVTGLWVAVAWHRFILIEETPAGPLPAFNSAAIGAYVIAGIIFALILIAVAIPISLVAGLLMAPMFMASGGQPGLVTGFILFAVVYLPVAWVGYRISPILPSAALGKRMLLKEAWYATGTSGAAFVVLTVITVVAGYLVNAPAQALPGILGVLWAFLANWASVLVGASILTTIYGHYVEGRQLDV